MSSRGACEQGVKHFAEQAGLTKRKTFTVKEIITKTKGRWGAETFSAFFAAKGKA